MANEDEFDFSDLCFANETNDLIAPETETEEFTDSEEELYLLTKGQIL
ncbi:2970_t:CDS:2 [Gigaspora rosea]|nr:2970_t:CDS:2 [Gigaspora rosea]